MTSHQHGSVAAAVTFGLPEATGARRNWVYCVAWVRDVSFAIYAFMRLGFVVEAERFRVWIAERVRVAERCGEQRVVYALDGSEAADRVNLDHLAGYAGLRSVRVGNAAHDQRQFDIYGELVASIYLTNKSGSAIGQRLAPGLRDHRSGLPPLAAGAAATSVRANGAASS